jgi:hypothetical protein
MLAWCQNEYGLVDIEPDERIQMDLQSLEQWASSHETDIRIVGAIDELAGGDEHEMERIWQDPTHQEINFVLSRVPEADHAEAFWGSDSLASIKNEC